MKSIERAALMSDLHTVHRRIVESDRNVLDLTRQLESARHALRLAQADYDVVFGNLKAAIPVEDDAPKKVDDPDDVPF